MTQNEIIDFALSLDPALVVDRNWGEKGVFLNPGRTLPKGVYVLTFKDKDGPNDNASKIDRGGLYRLNLGISRQRYVELFGSIPKRPAGGRIIDTDHDFSAISTIMPHPVYGWMGWVAVLNPDADTFGALRPLIGEAVQLAKEKFRKRKPR